MINLEDVALTYPDGAEALRGIDLRLSDGVSRLLGLNGAGKSSLMQLLATLRPPSRGILRFHVIDLLSQPQLLRRQLGYLPQDFGVYLNASAIDLLNQLAIFKGIVHRAERTAEIERLLTLVNLWNVRTRPVAAYSGGMRQRFGVAQALIEQPKAAGCASSAT